MSTISRSREPSTTIETEDPARPVRRRRPLPNGRAVVGGFLVTLSAVGVFASYTHAVRPPAEEWLVARRGIAVGQRLTSDDLGTVAMHLPPAVARHGFQRPEEVTGALVLSPLAAGELVQASGIVQGRDPLVDHEVSFPLAASHAVGGLLQPGERVQVLATYSGSGRPYTISVVPDALVMAVSRDESVLGTHDIVVTIGVDKPEQALALGHAVSQGDLLLVRATGADPTDGPQRYRPPDQPSRDATAAGP